MFIISTLRLVKQCMTPFYTSLIKLQAQFSDFYLPGNVNNPAFSALICNSVPLQKALDNNPRFRQGQ